MKYVSRSSKPSVSYLVSNGIVASGKYQLEIQLVSSMIAIYSQPLESASCAHVRKSLLATLPRTSYPCSIRHLATRFLIVTGQKAKRGYNELNVLEKSQQGIRKMIKRELRQSQPGDRKRRNMNIIYEAEASRGRGVVRCKRPPF